MQTCLSKPDKHAEIISLELNFHYFFLFGRQQHMLETATQHEPMMTLHFHTVAVLQ